MNDSYQRISISLPPELLARFDEWASRRYMSRSQAVCQAMLDWMDKYDIPQFVEEPDVDPKARTFDDLRAEEQAALLEEFPHMRRANDPELLQILVDLKYNDAQDGSAASRQ